MCGLAGFVDAARVLGADQRRETARSMSSCLAHRGPDGRGTWSSADGLVSFAHTRLAIIDLGPTGAQPMMSSSGNTALVLNGEIYNHASLRAELEGIGVRFRGTSDTEVLVELVERRGFEAAIARLTGMFAIAAWDERERTLHLARDPFGEKPLYYGWTPDESTLLFASELKAFRAHPRFEGHLDHAALLKFFRHGWVPGPQTIYRGVRKLTPGSTLSFRFGPPGAPTTSQSFTYFDARGIAARAMRTPFAGSFDEAIDEFQRLLSTSVRLRLVADVRVGAFLSGGIDSSSTVALMQALSARPVDTYTIGFRDVSYDEAPHARRIAQHLGTAHHELYASPDDALGLVHELPRIYDEPFADSSQLPTLLLARLTSAHVKVSLSGDGGDELFGGYARYALLRKVQPWFAMPGHAAVGGLLERGLGALARALPRPGIAHESVARLQRRAEASRCAGADDFYHLFVSTWPSPAVLGTGGTEGRGVTPTPATFLPDATAVERAMLADTLQYLPDDILVKVDRASMAHGLECRVPLLDPAVFGFAWSLPLAWRAGSGSEKRAVRALLARYVPPELFERPKSGFAAPIGRWLRGPLREWAEDLLSERSLRAALITNTHEVRARWAEHTSGVRDWQASLWIVLTWIAWHRTYAPRT